MARFRFEHRFAAPADAVAAAYADPALYATFAGSSKLAPPEVVSSEIDGERVTLRVRYRFIGDLSAAARAVLDPARLSWVVTTMHQPAERLTRFTMLADHYQDRFRSSGTDRVEPDGDGCRRITEGELSVRAPLVGGTVERVLIKDLDDHLAGEVAEVERFIAG